MLGDNPEKSKNPLKKAMRRRNAKTVQFAAPTYVEASDYDYSTEDEEHAMIDPYAGAVQSEESANGQPAEVEERGAPEEANVHATRRWSGENQGTLARASSDASRTSSDGMIEEPQLSPKLVDKTEAAPLKSRKGTPRNTDSFLKDDTIETRKITLTPGLLREDSLKGSINSSAGSSHNNSMESLVKTASPPEVQAKKDGKEKKKEKKQGMLSGLFKSKKKDKKGTGKDDAESDVEKASMDISRNSPRASPMPSGETSPVDRIRPVQDSRSPVERAMAATPRSGQESREPSQTRQQPPSRSKLQKQPPSNTSSPVREATLATPKEAFVAELEGSQAAYEMATGQEEDLTPVQSKEPEKEVKREKAKKAKQRMELDDFDSPASEKGPNPFLEQEQRGSQESTSRDSEEDRERLSESPVEITSGSFMHGTENIHIPTPGPEDQESDEDAGEQVDTPSTEPSIIEHPPDEHHDSGSGQESEEEVDNDPTPVATAPQSPQMGQLGRPAPQQPMRDMSTDSHTTASSDLLSPSAAETPISATSKDAWDDAALRSWLDGEEVKDMMYIIHDKSDVVPVSHDHPMMAGLFVEQRKGVQSMMGELDGLLGSYLQRKGISLP